MTKLGEGSPEILVDDTHHVSSTLLNIPSNPTSEHEIGLERGERREVSFRREKTRRSEEIAHVALEGKTRLESASGKGKMKYQTSTHVDEHCEIKQEEKTVRKTAKKRGKKIVDEPFRSNNSLKLSS